MLVLFPGYSSKPAKKPLKLTKISCLREIILGNAIRHGCDVLLTLD